MLSSRGALKTDSILVECAAAQPKTAKKIFLLSEAEKTWAAFGKVVRSQLIQNIPTHILKFGSIWFEPKLVVTDGPLKYYVRVPKFGFALPFVTTYGLESINVPVESLKTTAEKLPMDQIVAFSGVGAHTTSLVLQELFLFVGEGLFNGKVLEVVIPGVVSILCKREKAIVSFDEGLLDDLFAIDSRKWPTAVKEMAALSRRSQSLLRPSSSSSSRPRSSSSSRPATQPKVVEPRPAFVSGANGGRLFSELQNLAQRPVKVTPRPSCSRSEPLRAKAPQGSIAPQLFEEEEESVYEILSPERHNAQFDADERCGGDSQHDVGRALPLNLDDLVPCENVPNADEGNPSRPATTEDLASRQNTPQTRRGGQTGSVRDLLYPGAMAALPQHAEAPRTGRKRFGDPMKDNLGYLFN